MGGVDFKSLEESSFPKGRAECYQIYLDRLVDHLNYVHNTSHDTKYWEMIIGPWLVYFVWYMDYRYFGSDKPNSYCTQKYNKCFIPYDYTSFIYMFDDTAYPEQLDFIVHNDLNGNEEFFECLRYLYLTETKIKSLARKIYTFICRPVFRHAHVIMASPYFSIKNQFKIALYSRLKILPIFFQDINDRDLILISDYRKWRKPKSAFEDDLDRVLDKTILWQIPFVYLEGYNRLMAEIPPHSRNLKVICSSVGWQQDELFKVFSAAHCQKGARLVGMQHGGTPYGTGVSPIVLQERALVDKYLTWGWKHGKKDIPFVSMKFSLAKKEFDSRCHDLRGKNMLYATTSIPPYAPDGFGMLSGDDLLMYLKWQHMFVKSLSSDIRDGMVIRVYPGDYVYKNRQRDRFESLGLNLKFDENESLIDSLLKSRMVVLDNIQTVFFEVIACDIPVVVYHDESIWEFNQEFNSICGKMKKVGMLHASPGSAADFINRNMNDVETWWDSDEVRELVEHLKSTYARTTDEPEKMLVNKLCEIAGVKSWR